MTPISTTLLDSQLTSIAHVIQLSVAPVFLLTGIAAILGVLNNRLSRIVDRARGAEAQLPGATPARAERLRISLKNLAQRARLAGLAITLCTSSALLICSDIVVLFIGTLVNLNLAVIIAVIFMLALLSLIGGLIAFLREVYLATHFLRIGEPDPDQAVAIEPASSGKPPVAP